MYKDISSNKHRTILLMFVFVVLVGIMGWLFAQFWGEPAITPYVLAGAGVYVALSYFAGSNAALALNGARLMQKDKNLRLWRTVENLAITNGMPMPKIYIIDDPAPNAFATGRDPNHAVVAATTGLLGMMSDAELQGVMAHELGHVKNYDIRVNMIAFALVAVVSVLADVMIRMTWFRNRDNDNGNGIFVALGIIAAILAPLAAVLIQLSISRNREYLADATGALTTRYPEGLASALEKIGANGSVMQKQNSSTAHLFFANPLKPKGLAAAFSTHPPIQDRIARLRKMGGQA